MDFSEKSALIYSELDKPWQEGNKEFPNFSLDNQLYRELSSVLSDIQIIDVFRISRLANSYSIVFNSKAYELIDRFWNTLETHFHENSLNDGETKINFLKRFWGKK